jgi:hypothetical protein
MLKGLWEIFPPVNSGQQGTTRGTHPKALNLPPGVTVIRLRNCFDSYYCRRYGMEPELASLVTGRPVLGRNSSVHYFRSTSDRLHKEHWQAFQRFFEELLSLCDDPNLPSRLPECVPMRAVSSQPVGSLFYPDKGKLARFWAPSKSGWSGYQGWMAAGAGGTCCASRYTSVCVW